MKTPDEILTGLKCCFEMDENSCRECPYEDNEVGACSTQMKLDAFLLIKRLQDGRDTLTGEMPMTHDPVNHPSHYTQGGVECIDALKAATMGLKGIEAVCTANAIKYLWRWTQKNGAEDLRKAVWYIHRLIDEAEARDETEQ